MNLSRAGSWDEGDLERAYITMQNQAATIEVLEERVRTLSASDQGAALLRSEEKYTQLWHRHQDVCGELVRAQEDNAYFKRLLADVRKALKVERNAEILPAIGGGV